MIEVYGWFASLTEPKLAMVLATVIFATVALAIMRAADS